jgi:hypothetical protein
MCAVDPLVNAADAIDHVHGGTPRARSSSPFDLQASFSDQPAEGRSRSTRRSRSATVKVIAE